MDYLKGRNYCERISCGRKDCGIKDCEFSWNSQSFVPQFMEKVSNSQSFVPQFMENVSNSQSFVPQFLHKKDTNSVYLKTLLNPQKMCNLNVGFSLNNKIRCILRYVILSDWNNYSIFRKKLSQIVALSRIKN